MAVEALPYEEKGFGVDDCINPEGGALDRLPIGSAVGGPTMKAPDIDYFVSSWAVTFPDEAAASAWAATLDTEEHRECQRAALEAANGKGIEDFEVATKPYDAIERGIGRDHRVAAAAYDFLQSGQATSSMYVDVFQVGRTVITVQVQLGPMTQAEADAASEVEAGLRTTHFD